MEPEDYIIATGLILAFTNIFWSLVVGVDVGVEMEGKPRRWSHQFHQTMRDLKGLVKKEKEEGKEHGQMGPHLSAGFQGLSMEISIHDDGIGIMENLTGGNCGKDAFPHISATHILREIVRPLVTTATYDLGCDGTG